MQIEKYTNDKHAVQLIFLQNEITEVTIIFLEVILSCNVAHTSAAFLFIYEESVNLAGLKNGEWVIWGTPSS